MIKNLSIYSNKEIKINKKEVHRVISGLQKILNFSIDSLEINFINSDEILEINKNYLKHDYSTDIITFNYSGNNKLLDGEIFISAPDALENAEKFNVDFNQELLRLLIHGILHLEGYDDEEPEKKKVMKSLENKLVKELSEAEEKYKVV